MILFNKHKGTHINEIFTFVLITKLKSYQIRIWKYFWSKTSHPIFLQKETSYKVAYLEHYASNTKTNVSMLYPIRALCYNVL